VPAGWTLIRRTDNGSSVGVASYYKVAVAGEPASYGWTIGSGQAASGSISRYTNVDTANVLDPAASAGNGGSGNTGSGTAVAATAISTGLTFSRVIGVYATTPTTSFTKPAAMTERSDTAFASGGPTVEVADYQQAAIGSTLGQTATAATSGSWAAQLFALKAVPVDTYSIDVNDNVALKSWIPVGFTGTDSDSPPMTYNEAYSSAGVVNSGSHLAQAIQCFDQAQTDGTNLATPIRMATKYLQTYGRDISKVPWAIIIETDGYPQSCPGSLSPTICNEYTAPAAQAAADAAKAAGILVYTIGYNGGSLDATAATLLGNMASTKKGTSACNAAENTDGDSFFCAPSSADLSKVFQYVAQALSRGPHLVQMYAQPIITGVSPAAGSHLGGTSVVITGKYFTDAYSVIFGGTPASFTVVSDTQINAIAPAGAVGPPAVDIQVSSPGGSSKIVTIDHFTYN
jgi:hypothetical protein